MAYRLIANTRLLLGIIALIGACNVAIGTLAVVVPLVMDAEGDSKFLIGNSTMVGQVGVLIAGSSVLWLRAHVRSRVLMMVALLALVLCFVGFAFSAPLYAWFGLRFISGAAIATIFTTSETWLQMNTPDALRGRVMGTYMTSQTLTFALGPFLIRYIGFQGPLPWLFGAAALAFSLL